MEETSVLSVGELTRQLKDLVEANFPSVFVQAEISNLSRAGSGHVYLTLKDESAQIRAVIWRSVAQRIKFDLHDGLEVTVRGPVEIYAQRGSYQLIVQSIVPEGVGPLELAFRQLHQKLEREGLFNDELKKELPVIPRRIALVTSPTSAAVRDMLQVITRRWPPADIVVVPVAVQGEGAAEQIADALRRVEQIPGVDVVITGRGGGSLEDLWAFNEEIVARAIVACPIPVVSAVGHEIDVSISDLVADRRALTPSEAGEFVVPSMRDLLHALESLGQRLGTTLRQRLEHARTHLDGLSSRRIWSEPMELIRQRADQVDELERGLVKGLRGTLDSSHQSMELLARTLDALSPLKVLGRGYSMTVDGKSGRPIESVASASVGQEVRTRLDDGELICTVDSIEANAKSGEADNGEGDGEES